MQLLLWTPSHLKKQSMGSGCCWFCPVQSPQYLAQFLLQSRHWGNVYRMDEWISRICSSMVKSSGYIAIVKTYIELNLQHQLFWWSTAGWATLWTLDLMTPLSLSSRNTKHRHRHRHTHTHTHTLLLLFLFLWRPWLIHLWILRDSICWFYVCLFSLTYNTVTYCSCSLCCWTTGDSILGIQFEHYQSHYWEPQGFQ